MPRRRRLRQYWAYKSVRQTSMHRECLLLPRTLSSICMSAALVFLARMALATALALSTASSSTGGCTPTRHE